MLFLTLEINYFIPFVDFYLHFYKMNDYISNLNLNNFHFHYNLIPLNRQYIISY